MATPALLHSDVPEYTGHRDQLLPRAEGEHRGYLGSLSLHFHSDTWTCSSHGRVCNWQSQLPLENLPSKSNFPPCAISVRGLENRCPCSKGTRTAPSIRWFLRQTPLCGAMRVHHTLLSACISTFSQLWEDQSLPRPCSRSALRSCTQKPCPRSVWHAMHTLHLWWSQLPTGAGRISTALSPAQHTVPSTGFIALFQCHKKLHGFGSAHTGPIQSASAQNLCLPPNNSTEQL